MASRVDPSATPDDPFFAIGIDEIPTRGHDASSVWRYQLSQSIPFPGKLSAKGRAAEERARGGTADKEALERELTLNAAQSYFRLLFNQEALQLNARIKRLLIETANSAKARYRTGGSGHHEWLLAQSELAVNEVERLRLEREHKILLAVLNELRDKPLGAEASLHHEFKIPTGAPKANTANQPERTAFSAAVAAANADESAARLAYLPDFVLQGMLMKPRGMPADPMESAMPSSWGFMVGINVPLFFFRKQADLFSAAQFEKEAALADQKALENRLQAEVVDAESQFYTAKEIVELYQKSVLPSTAMAASNARKGYTARRLPLSELLDVLRAQRAQELELLAAKMDVEFAARRLENLLSAPPVSRFAPNRPTLFGGMAGASSMEMSGTVNMGQGMSGPTRAKPSGSTSAPAGGGMEGM